MLTFLLFTNIDKEAEGAIHDNAPVDNKNEPTIVDTFESSETTQEADVPKHEVVQSDTRSNETKKIEKQKTVRKKVVKKKTKSLNTESSSQVKTEDDENQKSELYQENSVLYNQEHGGARNAESPAKDC